MQQQVIDAIQAKVRLPRRRIVIPAAVAERAATRYVQNAEGCFISTYSVASHGYAQVGWSMGGGRSQMVTAHRAAWVHANGHQIPDGMTIDHVCGQRRCVNPAHLRVLSNFENARRTGGRDWPLGQCVNGHDNKHLRLSGEKLVCALCSVKWSRDGAARQKAATP